MMHELMLLSDCSVNPQTKIGYGAYLAKSVADMSLEKMRGKVKVRRFAQTSSTTLELQTLLWALSEIAATGCKLKIYTDSQNIIGLAGRRERLEQKDYRSKKNIRLKNAELYQEFYRLTDRFDCEFVKVSGHQPAKQKESIDRLFALVDKAARRALREDVH